MAWNYNGAPFPASPSTSPSDQGNIDSVRFLIGDTDTTDQQLADGEVVGCLVQAVGVSGFPNPYYAAMEACATLIARYARRTQKTTGDLSIAAGEIAQHYRDLRLVIQNQAARHAAPVPYAGGISAADADIDEENDDLNQDRAFSIGMDDNPAVSDADVIGGGGFSQAVPSG